MKREDAIRLEATPDEILAKVVKLIAIEQKVTVENISFDKEKGTVLFSCKGYDGHNAVVAGLDATPLRDALFGTTPTGRYTSGIKNKGILLFFRTLFAEGHRWPVQKLYEEATKTGYKLVPSIVRATVKKLGMIEIEPDVFQHPDFTVVKH